MEKERERESVVRAGRRLSRGASYLLAKAKWFENSLDDKKFHEID